MNFSIYDLDDKTRKLLDLDNFLGDLTVNEFVERLSKDHQMKQDNVQSLSYLDPKPYIRTFESTLRELKLKNAEIVARQEACAAEAARHDIAHSKNVVALAATSRAISANFGGLDRQVSNIIGKIGPLGDQLTRLTQQRNRALDTQFLLRCYQAFHTRGACAELAELQTSTDHTLKMTCAKTVRQLLVLAHKIDGDTAYNSIAEFGLRMEEEFIGLFQELSVNDHFDIMADIADILIEFNGGESVINTFVDDNDIFREREEPDLAASPLWDELSDVKHGSEIVNAELARLVGDLLSRVKMSVKMNARIAKKVFARHTVQVIALFLRKINQEVLQAKIAKLLKTASSISHLAYVKLVHALYVLIGDYIRDLKEFFVDNDFEDRPSSLSSTLDACYHELFHEYLRDDKFFAMERKNLDELIYAATHRFATYNESVLQAYLKTSGATTLLARIQRHSDDDEFNYDEFNRSLDADTKSFSYLFETKKLTHLKEVMKSHLERGNTTRASATREWSVPAEVAEEDRHISIQKVDLILKCCIEAMARLLELSPSPAKTSEYSLQLLEILLSGMGHSYIDLGLEVSYSRLKSQESVMVADESFYVDMGFLEIVNQSNESLYLFSTCVSQVILPMSINAPAIKERISAMVNGYIAKCEVSISILLKDTLRLVSNKIAYILANKQRKKDFTGDKIMNDDTEACEILDDFLTNVHDSVARYLTGEGETNNNLISFLTHVGTNFLKQLLHHFTKFQVNETGALILTKDIVQYQNLIGGWKIDALTSQFAILKEVASLFSVNVELLESLIQEGKLKGLSRNMIDSYMQKRTDLTKNGVMGRLKSLRA
ncbi:hypothetical protein BABINDRAFT_35695 [Babjeviella inositovora NRRL Y-12698]|uniref:Uncharacterized protein n=1 Tax=Babjeviella inositovora NRRL Y-12698 TaxID=984486 RepID=A0A1E3QQW4_9ASCO|nr:uncharacterized protein BABINDRAFT_35695 [Babjeviella inositovora NRRL Y-12698]ODQ80096.1 hypothetical protein BABINDRAFT_35695 [Babjeviella inositovora NRRL Y-12698]